MTADAVAGPLARFVHRLSPSDIPADVSLRARHLMLDAIGCAMAARREPFVDRFRAATRALSGDESGRSGVIGQADRVPLRDATLLNGVLMHGLDYDDTHIAGVVHLTVSVLPALLSLAARRGASGAELIAAYVAGMESGARLAMAARGGFHAQGLHPTGVVGAFAAAWAAGKLIGLDEAALVQAQGAALSMASGSLQFIEDGAWTKRLHAGWAAQAGLTAAMLASEGVVAPTAPYTGRYGLFHSFLDEAGRARVELDLAHRDLGSAWEVLNVAVKPFAMCHFVHAAADAAIALHRRGVDAEQVRDIEVLVPLPAVALVCEPAERKRRPATDYDAKFSLPYAVANGLLRGRLGLRDLEPAALSHAGVRALMDRVRYTVEPDSAHPRHYSGEVRLTMADGSRMSHRESINRGHADKPLSNDDVCEKFMDNATLHFDVERALAVRNAVIGLDAESSVRELEALLAC